MTTAVNRQQAIRSTAKNAYSYDLVETTVEHIRMRWVTIASDALP